MKGEFQCVFRMNLQLENMKMTIWRNWNKGKCTIQSVVGTEQVGVMVAILHTYLQLKKYYIVHSSSIYHSYYMSEIHTINIITFLQKCLVFFYYFFLEFWSFYIFLTAEYNFFPFTTQKSLPRYIPRGTSAEQSYMKGKE